MLELNRCAKSDLEEALDAIGAFVGELALPHQIVEEGAVLQVKFDNYADELLARDALDELSVHFVVK